MSSWNDVMDYCRTGMAFADKEQFRILFLDKRNQLIADEVQQTGTVDHTPVYPREVIKRALELSATALILMHNHPSGDPSPSQADIQMTKAIVDIASPLGISVHDHIIVGKSGHASLKGMRLIWPRACLFGWMIAARGLDGASRSRSRSRLLSVSAAAASNAAFGFLETLELVKQVAAHAFEQMIGLERRLARPAGPRSQARPPAPPPYRPRRRG